MTTMSGPSTGTTLPPRKSKTQNTRHLQRRWIALLDEWHNPSSTNVLGTRSRDDLAEEIHSHAEQLCRSVKDRAWLLDAFQLAITAVLSPGSGDEEEEEVMHIETLSQRLLQLARGSVAEPYVESLRERNADPTQIEAATAVSGEWIRLERRLAASERLRAMGLPALPLPLVLHESTSALLLCLASLPHAASVLGSLLSEFSWLVDEIAPARFAILRQLLVGARGREDYAALAEAGMLIGWADGHETGTWSKGVRRYTLGEVKEFYTEILRGLREEGEVDRATALLGVLEGVMEGEDAQSALGQLRTLANAEPSTSTAVATTAQTDQATAPRFDLRSINALAAQISTTSTHDTSQARQLATQLLTTLGAKEAVQRAVQLVDTHDSLRVRAFGWEVAKQCENVQLAAALLYARPAVEAFRMDLDAPLTLLTQADAVLAKLTHAPRGQNHNGTSAALRSALDLDPHASVPACQVHVLSRADNDVVTQARLHLRWLREVKALVEGQSSKPAHLDVCWLAAYAGSNPSGQDRQWEAFTQLVESFDAAHPSPASAGGRAATQQDPTLLRFRAGWDAFFHTILALTSEEGAPFTHVAKDVATAKLLSQVLRTGDVELFRSLSSTGQLSESRLEQLVLDVSTALFDQASVASTRSKDVRLALEVLSALPVDSARAESQKDFIEAACRLSSFKIKSIANPGQLMEPKEIRTTRDKMDLVARLLATQGDAHRSPELVLDVANRLCGIHAAASAGSADRVSDKTLVEARTLAMLADAATAAEDFDDAASFCQRLVDRVSTVRSRVATSASAAEIVEIAWKTCFQLSKHPLWEDTPSRISMLAHAMTLCPPTQLHVMLRQWQALDQQLVVEVEAGKEFASTKKAAAAAAGGMGWLGGGASARGVGDYISAQTAASVGAGLVGTAANLLPLSFSPLSYFGSSATGASTGSTTASRATSAAGITAEAQEPKVDARTARLFDFDNVSGASSSGGGGGGGYVDPTERAVRAARAARDFLGWKSDQRQLNGGDGSQQSQQQQQQTGGGGMGGFSFSRGVGWLIGDGESR